MTGDLCDYSVIVTLKRRSITSGQKCVYFIIVNKSVFFYIGALLRDCYVMCQAQITVLSDCPLYKLKETNDYISEAAMTTYFKEKNVFGKGGGIIFISLGGSS